MYYTHPVKFVCFFYQVNVSSLIIFSKNIIQFLGFDVRDKIPASPITTNRVECSKISKCSNALTFTGPTVGQILIFLENKKS